jgi:prepilin-type N-terminal cleavage/methylation domain-containing protein
MQHSTSRKNRGFSLAEVLVAVTLGALVVGAAVTMFKNGSDVSTVTQQRVQLQMDLRAAENLLIQDISLAGAGLPTGGIAVNNAVPTPRFGCDLSGVCYATQNFPSLATTPVTPPQAYYIIPGPLKGPQVTTGQPNTDTITVMYTDTNFLLNEYTAAFTIPGTAANPQAQQVTFTPPVTVPLIPPQAVNDPVVGLKKGDVVMFSNSKGNALAVITNNVAAGGAPGTFTAQFAPGDVLNINSIAAASPLQQLIITGGTGLTASRVFIISYYLDQVTDPGGTTVARLMRQVNTSAPTPLADNVVNMKFTYDSYDDTGVLKAELPDGGLTSVPPISPNLIQRVNLAALTARSATAGVKGYQGLSMQTQVSVRNLSFKDRYK